MDLLPLSFLHILESESFFQLHPELKWQFYFCPSGSQSEDYPATSYLLVSALFWFPPPLVNCHRECGKKGRDCRQLLTCRSQRGLQRGGGGGAAFAAPQLSQGAGTSFGRAVMLNGSQCLLLLEAGVETRQRMHLLFRSKRIPSHCFSSVECLGLAY